MPLYSFCFNYSQLSAVLFKLLSRVLVSSTSFSSRHFKTLICANLRNCVALVWMFFVPFFFLSLSLSLSLFSFQVYTLVVLITDKYILYIFLYLLCYVEQGTSTASSVQDYSAWKSNNCQPNFYFDLKDSDSRCGPYSPEVDSTSRDPSVKSASFHIPWVDVDNHDTIGMIALDSSGKMACATTTNGTRNMSFSLLLLELGSSVFIKQHFALNHSTNRQPLWRHCHTATRIRHHLSPLCNFW